MVQKESGFLLLNKNSFIYIPYAFIALLYFLFHMKYMPEYIDDAWTLSWAYRYMNFNDISDHVFGFVNSRGSILFGRGYSIFYGSILQLVGWTRSNAVIISTFFHFLTVLLWFKTVIKLGYSKKIAHLTAILMLLLEAYLASANKLRVDSMVFFLITMAFYLFIKKHYILAGFLSIIAFEVHPIALTFYFYILAYLMSILKEMRMNPVQYLKGAGLFVIGVLLGAIYYYFLQKENINLFFEVVSSEIIGHVFYSYFWKARLAWRHLPEAFILIVALLLYFYKKIYQKDKFIFPFFLCCIVSTFIIRRANFHYIIFVYPSVILLLSAVASEINKEKIFIALFILYLLPQYTYLYYMNHTYSQKKYEQNLKSLLPTEDKLILGNSGAWFGLKDRNFHEYGYYQRGYRVLSEVPQTFYLLSTQDYRENVGGSKGYNDKFFVDYTSTKIDEFITYDSKRVELYLMEKN